MKLRILMTLFPFLATVVAVRAGPLEVGAVAPAVTGVSEMGGEVDFAAVYARQPYTLVYFFPKAFTPGCTAQGCSLRDAYEALRDAGVAVIGVSADTVEAQRAFKAKYHFPFTLIADPEHKVTRAFGVPLIPSTDLAKRQAFLIKGGRIVWADHSASTSQQAEDVLRVLAGR